MFPPRRHAVADEGSSRAALVPVTALIGASASNAVGDEVGRVADLLVRSDGEPYPALSGVVLRVGRRRMFVHAHDVVELRAGVVVLGPARVVLEEFRRREGEVLLAEDLLDHQLVDLDGARVVRAADLYVAPVGPVIRLVGVDVGLRALTRRLLPGRRRGAVGGASVLDWAEVQPFVGEGGQVRLRSSGEGLRRLRPDQLADVLDDLGREERRSLLSQLDPETAADVLEEVPPARAAELLAEGVPERAAEVLEAMEPDEAAEALREVDESVRRRLLSLLAADEAERLDRLVHFTPDTAGGHMTPRLVLCELTDTVASVRERLRADPDVPSTLDAVVVVDAEGRVYDDVTMLELLLAPEGSAMADLTGPPFPIVVDVGAGLGEVVERFIDQRGASIVVVDGERRPVGRILADDLVDALLPVLDRGEPRRP